MNIEVLLILLAILVGMALLASQHLPEFTDAILSLVISSTIIFELIGPMMARKALILEKINGTGNPLSGCST